jgi:hypothetical protein
LSSLDSAKIQNLINEWHRIEEEFFKLLKSFYFGLYEDIKSCKVFITEYGTNSSFNIFDAIALENSIKYQEKLGVLLDEPDIEFKAEELYLAGKKVTDSFTTTQLILLKNILEKKGQIITFDELGDLIWNDIYDFSPWALTKNIQRLRDKLCRYGFSKNYIKTLRGREFIFRF